MIRKIGALGISLLCLGAIISCEKDFNDIGTNVVSNTKFETGEILLDVEIETIDLESVQADNINLTAYQQQLGGALGEYWLGVYNNPNAKKIEASIVSQIGYVSGLKNTAGIDTILNLEKVILKLPYPATSIGKNSDGVTEFKLDSILGNTDIETSVVVKQNNTYLNTLDPNDPSKNNTFPSDFNYENSQVLSENLNFKFTPKAIDTAFYYNRINRMNPSEIYEDVTKATQIINSDTIALPFLAIPLDLTKMEDLFWDKFESNEFSSKEEYENYFRGLIIESRGIDGSLVPFNLNSTPRPSLVFYYTKSIMDNGTVKDTINSKYSFTLSGIRNSMYKMTNPTISTPANNFVVQGTAGTIAKITVLDNTKLQEIRANNWLVNDASLSFYVNQSISADKNIIPQRLFIYQNKDNGNGGNTPTQLTDTYKESATFGGSLELTEGDKPEKYTFKITDYISDLLNGTTNDVSPLILKVYNNPTDNAVNNNALDVNVKSYNWNPRGVTLLDGKETVNGTKRAVLKISYSKEK